MLVETQIDPHKVSTETNNFGLGIGDLLLGFDGAL
jgi:hypothetical protein